MPKSQTIFVIEMANAPDLAFEAGTDAQAAATTRAPWFREAIAAFLAGTGEAQVICETARVRAATTAEANIYEGLRQEFDGPVRQFMVADLSGFPERHTVRSAAADL